MENTRARLIALAVVVLLAAGTGGPAVASHADGDPRSGPGCAFGDLSLTFDDGPQPGVTEPLLHELYQMRVRATFFEEGRYVTAYPFLARAVARTPGMVVENHSYDHPDLTRLSLADARAELVRTQEALTDIGVPAPTLVRYPYGRHNPALDAMVRSLGMHWMGWNAATGDPHLTSAAAIFDAARADLDRDIARGRTHHVVMLMHDGQADSALTVAAVPAIVAYARARGFCLVNA